MTAILAFIKRHPALTFYIVVFGISWGGFFSAVGPTTHMEVVALPPAALLSMAAGPVVGSLLLIGLVYGRAGFRDFGRRLLKWRVAPGWYAVALLLAPLMIAGVLSVLSLASPAFLPGLVTADDKVGHLLSNLMIALVAGLFEEIGWTGFAVPTLRQRYGVFATGLIVGVLWGAWHFLGNVAAAETVAGTVPVSVFLTGILIDLLIGSLAAFRVLMVWVYDRSGGSLLVAILMHMSYTAAIRVLNPVPNEGVSLLIYGLALAIVQWLVVAVVVMANRGQRTRQPLYKEASVAGH